MRVVTLNMNGIRSATHKGFWQWLARQRADVVCLQETRSGEDALPLEVSRLRGWHRSFLHASKKGYSGVAVLTRREPDDVKSGIGWSSFDEEGRWLEVRLGQLSIVSLYVPSGSNSGERQAFKMRCLDELGRRLGELGRERRHYLVCGDLNVAHTRIDLANWRGNQKNSGFLPEERAWLDRLFEPRTGWVDAFRAVDPRPQQYTFWSNRGQAWAKNVGWRLDYQLATAELGRSARAAAIYKRRRFSDHAPVSIDYRYELGGPP